jgi:hypothetical protein
LAKAAIEDLATAQMQADADAIRSAADYAGVYRDMYLARATALDTEIAKRKEIADLLATGAVLDENAAAAKKSAEEWKKANDEVSRSLSDGLMRAFEAGKGFAVAFRDTLVNMFKTMVLTPIIQFILSPLTGAIATGMAGFSSPANAGTPGASVMGGWLNAGSTLNSGYNALNGGLSSAYLSAAGSSAGSAMGLGGTYTNAQGIEMSYASPAGSALGTGLGYAGAGLAGIAVGSAIAGNRTVVGLDGTSIAAIGAVIGSIWGPVGTFVGAVAGGVLDRAFGSGPKESAATTLAGKFSQGGFSGNYQTPWSQSGGWFSSGSSGIDTTALQSTQSIALQNMVTGTASVFDKLIAASGDANKSLDGWTFAINQQVNTTAQQTQLTVDLANSMGNYLIPSLAKFQATGENLADTAVRMTDEFILTNTIATMLGQNVSTAFGAVGLASLQARDNLVTLMGGIQTMSGTVQSYYTNFYTDAQRHANDLKTLTAQFASLGLALPASDAAFRALVESQNLSTASGQQMFASLMSMNGAFAALFGTMQSVSTAAAATTTNLLAMITTDSFKSMIDYKRAIGTVNNLAAPAQAALLQTGTSSGIDALIAEIRSLRSDVVSLQKSAQSTAQSSLKTSLLLRNVTQDGNSLQTTLV